MRRWSLPGSRGDGGRLAVVAYLLCAVYLHVVVSLLSWTVLPAVAGFSPTLIVSGSMSPRINAGDVVLLDDPPAQGVRRGNVITFADANRSGRLLTHRVVRRNADGTYTTRGDANQAADSHDVAPALVRGIGRVVVPAVGAPAMWIRDRNWAMLLGWLALSALAFGYLYTYARANPALWGWSAALDARPVKPVKRSTPAPVVPRGGWEPPLRPLRRARWAMPTLILLVGVVAATLPAVLPSEGAFSSGASNPDNSFVASTAFCETPGPQTLTPTADAKINQNAPAQNFGATADLVVEPRTNRVNRSFLTFALPAQPAHCVMTATLRMYVTAGVANRTLEVLRSAGAWAEGTIMWNGAPTTTGTAVTQPSRATAGWIEWTVTDHVAALYAGANNGFIVKDATESGGAGLTQTFSSRTGANPPELVLNFATAPSRPDAPSALTATPVSAARINLGWADNADNETGFILQRSPAGLAQWTEVGTPAADVTTFNDNGLVSETAYDYRVRATNAQGNSPWSDVATATTLPPPAAPPTAPSALSVTSTGVNNALVAWSDNSTDEDSFVVERSLAGAGNWSVAGSAAPDATTLDITGLAAGTAYDVRVRAVNNAGASSWSNTVTATTTSCAALPNTVLTSTADAAVMQAFPTTAIGTASPGTFMTRSSNAANGRSLVRFNTPTVPAGCTIATATLRLNVSAQTAARTLQVVPVDVAWSETTVTWNTQPAATGTVASAVTAVGWVQWTVTSQIQAQLSGTNHGFLVRDSVENAGAQTDVTMSPREGANPPQLVIAFGP